MREILFKAKRLDNGEWVEGYYQQRYEAFGNVQRLIFWAKSYTVWEYAEVDPETICQYTGLTDKNGEKIWENDIVERNYTLYHGENKKTREMQIGVVNYSNKSCCFMIGKKTYLVKPWDGDALEVVGNIFDNAELLEE